jgi:hypothetical protein
MVGRSTGSDGESQVWSQQFPRSSYSRSYRMGLKILPRTTRHAVCSVTEREELTHCVVVCVWRGCFCAELMTILPFASMHANSKGMGGDSPYFAWFPECKCLSVLSYICNNIRTPLPSCHHTHTVVRHGRNSWLSLQLTVIVFIKDPRLLPHRIERLIKLLNRRSSC